MTVLIAILCVAVILILGFVLFVWGTRLWDEEAPDNPDAVGQCGVCQAGPVRGSKSIARVSKDHEAVTGHPASNWNIH